MFKGRLSRRSFIIQSAVYSLISAALEVVILYVVKDTVHIDEFGQISIAPTSGFQEIVIYSIYLVFLIIGIKLLDITVRRGHDIGLNGWVSFVLFLSGFGLLYLVYKKGDPGENKYSPGYKLTPEMLDKQFSEPSTENKVTKLEKN